MKQLFAMFAFVSSAAIAGTVVTLPDGTQYELPDAMELRAVTPEPTPEPEPVGFFVNISEYGTDQDLEPNAYAVSEDGNALQLTGNTWKKVSLDSELVITQNTVLKFTAEIRTIGEIHGIGFDNDVAHGDEGSLHFQVAGTQKWQFARQSFDAGVGAADYEIPLGEYAGQVYKYITFSNDDDAGTGISTVWSNVRIEEVIPEPTPDPEPEPTPEPDPVPEPEPEPEPTPEPPPIPNPDTRPEDAEIIRAIMATIPEQHATETRFKKIPGSEIDVLVKKGEFSFGANILDYNSYKSFMDWTGGAWNWNDWEFANPAGGGHYDYGGNELYIANLIPQDGEVRVKWSRPINPQPLQHGLCGAPAEGPNATHTYGGVVWVEKHGVYFHSASGGFPATSKCEGQPSAFPGNGGWATDKKTWTKVVPTTLPDGQRFATNYPRTCYLRGPDLLYMVTGSKANIWTIDPQNDWATTGGPTGGYVNAAGSYDAAADQQRNICYVYRGQVGIQGVEFDPETRKIKRTAYRSGETVLEVPSLSVEHSTGNLVIVGTRGKVQHIDVSTDTITDISATDGSGIPYENNVADLMFGKVEMMEKVPCVGVGISDARDGVTLFVLPKSVCTLAGSPNEPVPEPEPTPDPPPEPPVDRTAFMQSCAQPGVVFCDPLSDHGPYAVTDGALTDLGSPASGLVPPAPTSSTAAPNTWWRKWRGMQQWRGSFADYDPVMNALKLTMQDSRGTDGSGLFTTNFSKDTKTQFVEGQTFSVQWQVKYNCDAVYMDCDPTSSTYKTDRRPIIRAGAPNGTQGFKIAIIGEGDPKPGESAGACERIQLVPHQDFGALRIFHDCGKYDLIERGTGTSIGGSAQMAWQWGDYNCLRFPDNKTRTFESWSAGGTGPDCAMIEADKWLTIKVQLAVGDWNQANSRIQMWAGLEGEPLRRMVDRTITVQSPNASKGFYGFGKVWFQMHTTKADRNVGSPDRIAWYRNLIVRNEG